MDQTSYDAGAAAYAAGLPCIEPAAITHRAFAAAWRVGWKKAAARAGDQEAVDRAMVLTEQRRAYGAI